MSLFKFLRIAVGALLGVSALIAMLIAVLMRLDVSIPASPLRQALVDAASTAIGYDMRVEGEIHLAISYFPELLINNVHIENQGEWQYEDMLSVRRARVKIALRPLLRGRFEFAEVMAEGITVNLEQQQDQRKNWISNLNPAVTERTKSPRMAADVLDTWLVETFRLSDVELNYRDDAMQRTFSHRISQLQIDTLDRSRLEAQFSGESNGVEYSYTASAGLIRELLRGQPWRVKAAGEVGGHPLTLDASVKTIEGGELQGQLNLDAQRVDVGRFLNQLGITEDLVFSAKTLMIEASLAGNSLGELLDQSSFQLVLKDGNWKLGNHVNNRFQDVQLKKVEMTALKTAPSQIRFDGSIGAEPLNFTLRSNPLGDFVRGLDSVKLDLNALFADARLELQGDVNVPVSSKTLIFDMQIEGRRLDDWNSFLASALPPFGPYRLAGTFDMNPKGFHISEIQSKVGESQLDGTIDVDITGERPLWKMDLYSALFQLDDFMVEGYSMIPGKTQENPEDAKQLEADLSRQVDRRLSESRQIDLWDVDVKLKADQVRSGDDQVGSGTIILSGRQNSFDQAFSLDIPGGSVQGKIGFNRDSKGLGGYAKLDIDRFDYGVFLRRMNPENETDGLLSAKIDITLSGKNYSRRFEHSNGTLDFVIWPRNIDAEVMDFWAVNLFFAILPPLSEDTSKVNCLVSLLDIEDGIIREEFFAVDSSKVWLNGNLDVNFRDESIDLALYPRPKKPRIFALETPIHIKGDFEQQALVIMPVDMVGSVVAFIFSPLHVPMRRIFGREVPEDASETCGQLLDRDYLKSLKISKTPARTNEPPNY